MITTHQKRIPWWWAFLICLPSFSTAYVEHCSGAALTFTMKKFISDPSLLVFLGSINIAFNFMVAPFIAWKSDRIWTRFGRRKPFIIAGWVGLIVSLILTPLAPNIWILTVVVIAYQFFEDVAFSGPFEPLYYEVVPLPQRGRMAAVRHLLSSFSGLFFNFFMIGHFDEVHSIRVNLGFLGQPQVVITGQTVIFYGAAAMIVVMIAHVCLNVKETPVQNPLVGDRFSMGGFLVGVFGERQWRMIYLLIFSQIAMNTGLGQMGTLMTTEQFGYSKQVLGELTGITLILKMALVIPAAGYLADKVDRLRMFQAGLFLSTLHPILYWLFIKFIALHQIPSPQAIVGFNIFGSFVDVAGNIALGPLLFDYVPRNKMGTVYAGMTFARGMVKLTIVNGVGLWVKCYSRLLLPGGYDYSSGLLYIFLIGLMGCAVSVYFVRERKKGRVIEYGRLDLENGQKAAQAERPR